MSNVVCASCFDGMHSACTGAGCNCDCQYPDDALEDIFERQNEEDFRKNGYE